MPDDTTQTPETSETTEGNQPKPADPDTLGEGGKKALDAEREARKTAEKAARELAAKVKQYEDRDKTEAEKVAERIASLEAENGALMAEKAAILAEKALAELRSKVSETAGVPAQLLVVGQTEDEMTEWAKQLSEWKGAKPGNTTPPDQAPKPVFPQRQMGMRLGVGSQPDGMTDKQKAAEALRAFRSGL